MTTDGPTAWQIRELLLSVRPAISPFAGTAYRSCSPQYATADQLLTGDGARRYGGRWNPVGIATVYLCLTPETALAEAFSHFRYYGLPVAAALPRTFVAVEVDVASVIDLHELCTVNPSEHPVDVLMAADWRRDVGNGRIPLTQRLGLAVFDMGLEGLLVPSAADGGRGRNLVLFPENLHATSRLSLQNVDRL